MLVKGQQHGPLALVRTPNSGILVYPLDTISKQGPRLQIQDFEGC